MANFSNMSGPADERESDVPTWRQWSGRSRGGDGYQVGDVARHYCRRLFGQDVPRGPRSRRFLACFRPKPTSAGETGVKHPYTNVQEVEAVGGLASAALATNDVAPSPGLVIPRASTLTRSSCATMIDDPTNNVTQSFTTIVDESSNDVAQLIDASSFTTLVDESSNDVAQLIDASSFTTLVDEPTKDETGEPRPETSSFGDCGLDISLEDSTSCEHGTASDMSSHGIRRPLTVAARRAGSVVNGVTLVAPVPISTSPSNRSVGENLRYSFDFDVLELQRGSVRTLSVGVVLDPSWAGKKSLSSIESANLLPRAFIVGGDPPRWFFDTREVAKVVGWRPIRDVKVGSTLQVVLEATADSMRLAVLQDGQLRTEQHVTCSTSSHLWAFTSEPRGVVDVCGTVKRVRLLGQSLSFF
eukprot:TRINITY_DN2102_c0_g1_i1.p1 TRINITY_DN2102_c0_g1~~TRINITY_DN2102_c0_g1_i1.p1  ORF type:complete len:426 (-),score=44.60 TRINITY_DN2102_c0_g1_i1:77-1318(-)